MNWVKFACKTCPHSRTEAAVVGLYAILRVYSPLYPSHHQTNDQT